MSRHDELIRAASAAIYKLFADRTVSRQQTHDSLVELSNSINMKLEALDAEIEREQAEAE